MNALPPRRGHHLVTAGRAFSIGESLVTRLMAGSLHRIVDRVDNGLSCGMLELWLPDGGFRALGGRQPGPVAEVHLHSWRAVARLVTSGSAGWYRAWARGEWSSPDPVQIFALFMVNARTLGNTARASGPTRWLGGLVHWLRRNSRRGSRRNIAFHYDLGNDFYRLWLDENMHYSSGIFASPGETLEQAQQHKVNAVLDRLELCDGDCLLEIGCGWGGFAAAALTRGDIGYHGLTLSQEQKIHAERRIAPAMANGQARILLEDYRDIEGRYDAIASIEMVEAVGQRYWPDYLAAIHRLLKPGGRAVVQFIAIDDSIFDRYAANTDFIQAYIFPGGLLLSEKRFRELAILQGLAWTDVHHFGADYAETLLRWRDRFDGAVIAGRMPASFDRHFLDLWRYYLMYCEGGFRGGGIDVAQVTLVKPA